MQHQHTGDRIELLRTYANTYRDLAREALCYAIRGGGVQLTQAKDVWQLAEIIPTAHFRAMQRYKYRSERYLAASGRALRRKPEVPEAVYLHAIQRLDQQLACWRDRGVDVAVEKEPYHRGNSNVRAVLRWYGQPTRFFYSRSADRWRKA